MIEWGYHWRGGQQRFPHQPERRSRSTSSEPRFSVCSLRRPAPWVECSGLWWTLRTLCKENVILVTPKWPLNSPVTFDTEVEAAQAITAQGVCSTLKSINLGNASAKLFHKKPAKRCNWADRSQWPIWWWTWIDWRTLWKGMTNWREREEREHSLASSMPSFRGTFTE